MKRTLVAAIAIVMSGAISGAALAQAPAANQDPATPATNPAATNPSAPAAGANSFTEGQAKSRIEAAGFTGVTGLMKDKDGVWRGKATKAGSSHDVALDYQGNVFPK